jgi:hypothetical protein
MMFRNHSLLLDDLKWSQWKSQKVMKTGNESCPTPIISGFFKHQYLRVQSMKASKHSTKHHRLAWRVQVLSHRNSGFMIADQYHRSLIPPDDFSAHLSCHFFEPQIARAIRRFVVIIACTRDER